MSLGVWATAGVFLIVLSVFGGMANDVPTYHLYSPSEFLGYTNFSNIYNGRWAAKRSTKHSVDLLFIHQLVTANTSVPVKDADLFIIPMLGAQSENLMSFENHANNVRQMLDVLATKPAFFRNDLRNHVLIVKWKQDSILRVVNQSPNATLKAAFHKKVMFGVFECDNYCSKSHSCFGVGYSSILSLKPFGVNCAKNHTLIPRFSMEQRKYLVSFVGQFDGRQNYKYRRLMFNQLKKESYPDMYMKFFGIKLKTRIPCEKALAVMYDSQVVISLPGDTCVTDRIYNAFDSMTLIAALSHDHDCIAASLAFPSMLNWKWNEIIVWVDSAAYIRNSVQAVRNAVQNLSSTDKSRRLKLMQQIKPDLIWGMEGSRCMQNTLKEAYKTMMLAANVPASKHGPKYSKKYSNRPY